MKKILTLLLTLIALFSFVACSNNASSSGTATIVIGGETEVSYTVDLAKVNGDEGALSVLKYLQESKKIALSYSGTGATTFLTEVGSLKPDSANGVYIYVFTSVEKDFDVSSYKTTKEYNGTTLTSSGVGITQMTVSDGAIIYIGTISYNG